MGEVLIVRRGGGKAALKSISVKTPPAKLEYLAGDTFDATGLVLTALIGDVEVDITAGYTITPTTLTADTTAVTISYTAGGKTVSTTQAVSVQEYYPDLEQNSWNGIARVCELGLASTLWQVGDQKTLVLGENSYTVKIVAFDHHALADTDAKYNNASYNGGKNKAGITFMMMQTYAEKAAFSTDGSRVWENSTMRNTLLPSIKATAPQDLQNNLRIVTLSTTSNGSSSGRETKDDFFLPAQKEILSEGASGESASQFAYFAAGNATKPDRNYLWTRSAYNAGSNVCAVTKGNFGENSTGWSPTSTGIFEIAFCL